MIEETENNTESHLRHTENNGHLHFNRIGEHDHVLRKGPDGVQAKRIGSAKKIRSVRIQRDSLIPSSI